LAAPPSYKDFLLILMVQHLCFSFQLVSSLKKCPFGMETTFDGTIQCGIWRAKIPVVLQNLVQKRHKPCLFFRVFLRRL